MESALEKELEEAECVKSNGRVSWHLVRESKIMSNTLIPLLAEFDVFRAAANTLRPYNVCRSSQYGQDTAAYITLHDCF